MTSLAVNVTSFADVTLTSELTSVAGDGETGDSSQQHPCGLFLFILYGPLFGSVCFLGIAGNVVSFVLLHKYSPNSVSSYLLKALAVADNMFLIAASGVQIYPAMLMYLGAEASLAPIYPYIQTYAWPLVHMAQMASVWMTVLVAGNRYVAVCKPLHAQYLCTKGRVRTQMWVVILLVVVYNIPRFFEYQFVMVPASVAGTSGQNGTTALTTAGSVDDWKLNSSLITTDGISATKLSAAVAAATTPLARILTMDDAATSSMMTKMKQENVGLASLPLYNIVYENISYCLFVFFLPLSVLIFFNAHLVNALKRARRQRKRISSKAITSDNNIASRVRSPSTSTLSSVPYVSGAITPQQQQQQQHQQGIITQQSQEQPLSPIPGPSSQSINHQHQQLQHQRTSAVGSVAIKRAATSADENNVTLVMIVIVLVFIVCETPAALNQILFYVFEDTANCTHYVRFYNICNLLVVLNSSLNFVIYCLFRRRFQQQLVDLCFCCRRSKGSGGGRGVSGSGGRLVGVGPACETSFVDHHRLRTNFETDNTVDCSSSSAQRASSLAASRDMAPIFRGSAAVKSSHRYMPLYAEVSTMAGSQYTRVSD